jgi:hypothetical protein
MGSPHHLHRRRRCRRGGVSRVLRPDGAALGFVIVLGVVICRRKLLVRFVDKLQFQLKLEFRL